MDTPPKSSPTNRPPVQMPRACSLEVALKRCQQLGLRLSRQRRAIIELLWQTEEHLSARCIYDRLTQTGQDIGYTSVYQNLEALSGRRIIECIERGDGRLYGRLGTAHSHVNCLDTGKIIDVYVELPETILKAIEDRTGLKIAEYRIDFYGRPHHLSDPRSATSTSPDLEEV